MASIVVSAFGEVCSATINQARRYLVSAARYPSPFKRSRWWWWFHQWDPRFLQLYPKITQTLNPTMPSQAWFTYWAAGLNSLILLQHSANHQSASSRTPSTCLIFPFFLPITLIKFFSHLNSKPAPIIKSNGSSWILYDHIKKIHGQRQTPRTKANSFSPLICNIKLHLGVLGVQLN